MNPTTPHRWSQRSIPWFGGLFIVVALALAGYDIVRGQRAAIADTGSNLQSQARVIAEQTARSLQAVDLVLRHIAEDHRSGKLAALGEPELLAYLQDESVGLVQAEGLAMLDAAGNTLAGSLGPAVMQAMQMPNESGSAALPAPQNHRALGLVVGNTMRSGPNEGRWVFPLARRLETAAGDFAGTVVAGGKVDYFQQFYRDLRLDTGTRVTLMHRNGTMLARYPETEAALGKAYPPLDLTLAMRDAGQPMPWRATSPVDGVERFGALAIVAEHPLAVVVTRDVSMALAPWRAQAIGTGARTIALALLAGLLIELLRRQFMRLDNTRASLQVSQDRFALAAEGADVGIWDWEFAEDRVFASPRAREIFGVGPGPDITPRAAWFEAIPIHPDDAAARDAAISAHLAAQAPTHSIEYRVRRADGSYRWIRVRGLCVRDAAGQPARMAGSVADIDAARRAEQALRTNEERFALAMTGSNEGHWVWDIGTDELYASARLSELLGLPCGMQLTSYREYFARLPIHPDDRARVTRQRDDHLAGTVPQLDLEYRIVLPETGEIRWIHSRGQCFRDEQGRPVRMAGSTVDITQRKSDEEALRRSEQRFALAVAGSDDGVWDWDYGSGLAFESSRARELQGLPPGPEVQPIDTLVQSLRLHPDDVARRAEGLRAHLAGETPAYEIEYRVLHPDAVYRWVRVRALCTRDANGKPGRMAGSVSDIDERKRAEQARCQSEERFALAVAGSNDGILDWDIVNDSMYVSERALRIAGFDPATTRVHTRGDWAALLKPRLHPSDARRLGEELRQHPERQVQAHEGEYRLRHPDGEYRWIRFRGMSVHDADGRPVRWAGSLSDIDTEKKTAEALRRSEERYQLAVAGSNEGLWDWDLASDLLFLSARAQEQLWLEPGEPLRARREWIALTRYHPDDEPVVRSAISAHLHGFTQHFGVEYRVRHHSGQWHWYRQRGIAVRDAAGRPTRMAGSMEDITDRKNSEAARERLEAQLRQAQKLEAIGTLAGGIAHDFNNILAAILGYGEMAQKDAPEGSAQRRHIDAAISAGMRAKSLVERILAFSRSGVGERVPVHVQSVVTEALDVVAASLPPGIRLERRLDAGDAAVLGDPTQVHQVLMNLCANAVQAMRAGGEMSVTLDRVEICEPRCATSTLCTGSYVRLQVRDSGMGIAPDLLERIFDPFFTTKKVGVGTGLGLSLVHGIVTDLGGGIEVNSRPGEGATFTVYLPWDSSMAVPPLEIDSEQVPGGSGETVLLVDDEEALVRLGEEMIAGLGYEPVGFTSSMEALATFRASPERFDAVLSDEAMPDMTGSELAKQIRAIRGDIPIVLMSGYVTPGLNTRARDAGVLDVLAKPLVQRDIARSLASALNPR